MRDDETGSLGQALGRPPRAKPRTWFEPGKGPCCGRAQGRPKQDGCSAHDSGSSPSPPGAQGPGRARAGSRLRAACVDSAMACRATRSLPSELWEGGDRGPWRHSDHYRQVTGAGSEPQTGGWGGSDPLIHLFIRFFHERLESLLVSTHG